MNTTESSVVVLGLLVLFDVPTRLPWGSRLFMFRDNSSVFVFGKNSDIGDKVASIGSSQRIQSSKDPKSNASSDLITGLFSCLEWSRKTGDSGVVGEVRKESSEKMAGSVYGLESQANENSTGVLLDE